MRPYVRAAVGAFCASILAACAGAAPSASAPAAAAGGGESLLVASAASDFRVYVAANGAAFRGVYPGTIQGKNGGVSRRLICGEYRVAGEDQWQAFATLGTAPYENWLRAVALGHCQASATRLDTGRDLSTALLEAYDAGRP